MSFKFYNKIKNEINKNYWPIYFNTDVLSLYKYKDEYFINNRRIEYCNQLICSKFFLSSEGDQVIITQKDFHLLPKKEKMYWEFFKESPKSDISEEMYKNIYLGEWIENDTITNIREVLLNFPTVQLENEELIIWKQPKSKTPYHINNLYYVVSGSKREWANEILTLDKNIIEGLQVNSLKKISKELKCNDFLYDINDEEIKKIGDCLNIKNINPKLKNKLIYELQKSEINGSINLLEKCLIAEDIDKAIIESIIKPLRKLKDFRSKIIAHNVKDFPKEDLRKNFKLLVEQCNTSLIELSNLINKKEIFYFE